MLRLRRRWAKVALISHRCIHDPDDEQDEELGARRRTFVNLVRRAAWDEMQSGAHGSRAVPHVAVLRCGKQARIRLLVAMRVVALDEICTSVRDMDVSQSAKLIWSQFLSR